MTAYRAMCSELLAWAEHTSSHYYKQPDVLDRARALLAQPVAEGPTDEEIMELMPQQMRDDLAAAARALTGDIPWPDNPKAAVAMRIILNRHAVDHARAVLARWGNSQGILDSSPQPPADGEVAELVEWLRESLDCALQSGNSKSIKNHCRLLDLLGRPTPQPVAVSERLPGPGDVNEDGNCWLWDREGCFWDWTYIRTRTRAEMYTYTHWLPANALPTPEATND